MQFIGKLKCISISIWSPLLRLNDIYDHSWIDNKLSIPSSHAVVLINYASRMCLFGSGHNSFQRT